MEHRDVRTAAYRFDDHGPAYLLRGPRTDVGIVLLRPGDDVVNHYHARVEETFIPLEGEATLWIGCRERVVVRVGDVYQSPPGEMHYFVNESDQPFRMMFVKAPHEPQDTVPVAWHPGDPVPDQQPPTEGNPQRG